MTESDDANDDAELLNRFKNGDEDAANVLFERYYKRVARVAEQRIAGYRLPATSGEDIAASVFESLWKKADQGGFEDCDLNDINELWRLLCSIVKFKAQDHVRREHAKKRGDGVIRGESVFQNRIDGDGPGIDQFAVDFDSVSESVGFREQFQKLLASLGKPVLSEIATLRLEGYSVVEISKHFDRSDRWAKRKLALIRDSWKDLVEHR